MNLQQIKRTLLGQSYIDDFPRRIIKKKTKVNTTKKRHKFLVVNLFCSNVKRWALLEALSVISMHFLCDFFFVLMKFMLKSQSILIIN